MDPYIDIPLLRNNLLCLFLSCYSCTITSDGKIPAVCGFEQWLAVQHCGWDPSGSTHKKSKMLQGISTSNRLETIHLALGGGGTWHPFCILCKRTMFVYFKFVNVVSHTNADFLFLKNWINGRSQADREMREEMGGSARGDHRRRNIPDVTQSGPGKNSSADNMTIYG